MSVEADRGGYIAALVIAEKERDQLKADNETLRTELRLARAEIERLGAIVEVDPATEAVLRAAGYPPRDIRKASVANTIAARASGLDAPSVLAALARIDKALGDDQ